MAFVVRNTVKLKGSLANGAGDDLLTRDGSTKEVGTISGGITSLTNSFIFIGNALDVPVGHPVSGDVSLTNTGIVEITPGVIVNADVNTTAAIALTKLAALTPSRAAITDSLGFFTVSPTSAIQIGFLSTTTSDVQVQINAKQATITGAATTIVSSNLTANLALISNGAGKVAVSTVTATELGFSSGVLSPIQPQLNTKLTVVLTTPAEGDLLVRSGGVFVNSPVGVDGQVWTVVSGVPTWSTGTANGIPPGGSTDQYLTKIDGTSFNTQWSTLVLSKVTDVSATAAQVNVLATGFYDATSSVQNQLNNKLSNALTTGTFWVGVGGVATPTTDLPLGTTLGTATIYTVGGSDVTLADGGTGASLADPGGDRILFWDDSANQVTWLEAGSGLTITGTVMTSSGGGGGLTDGDKGDITVSSSGAVWIIDPDAVTFNKMQDIATDKLMGRDSPSTGTIEALDVGGGIEFTGALGIQTSAFTGDVTKPAGSTVLTIAIDAVTLPKLQDIATDRLLGRDSPSTGTVEQISVGGGIEFTTGLGIQVGAFTGDVTKTAGGTVLTIATDAVTFVKFQKSLAGLSVVGRPPNTGGDFSEIVATSDFNILRRSGSSIGFGAIDLSQSGAVGSSILPVANGGTGASTARILDINGVAQSLAADRTWRTGLADTGALTYAGITIASGTQVNIGAATGYIIDNETTPGIPVYTAVTYAGELAKTVTTLGSGIATYVLLNSAGTIVFQNTFPTSAQRKTHIFLSKIGHPAGTITTAGDEVDFITSPLAQFRDFFQMVKYVNSGVYPSPNGVNLNFNTSAGTVAGDGINFVADRTTPNILAVASTNPCTFSIRTQTGAGGAPTTAITPGNYDVGGTITAIPGGANTSTIQYIFLIPGLGFVVQLGQTTYSSLNDAIQNIGKENSFVLFPSLIQNAILIGGIALTKTAINLSDTSVAVFFRADIFGQLIGSSGGTSVSTMQQVYNNSGAVDPQILTSTTNDGVKIRRGSAADTDNVFIVQNGSGIATFTINGNGAVTAGIWNGTPIAASAISDTAAWKLGGNTATANATIGTNDAFTFSIETSGTNRMTFGTLGQVTHATGSITGSTGLSVNTLTSTISRSNNTDTIRGYDFRLNYTGTAPNTGTQSVARFLQNSGSAVVDIKEGQRIDFFGGTYVMGLSGTTIDHVIAGSIRFREGSSLSDGTRHTLQVTPDTNSPSSGATLDLAEIRATRNDTRSSGAARYAALYTDGTINQTGSTTANIYGWIDNPVLTSILGTYVAMQTVTGVHGFALALATVPTAVVDVAASTTARASLRIRTGVAPTTPNDGDIWQDGTDIKIRIGGVTKTFTLV